MAMVDQPLVVTVILNTNRCDDTLETIASLERGRYSNQKIIVLDNASTDGSIQAIRARHAQVHLIELEENLGYAGNNNVGIQKALDIGADWVFVLNEDTLMDADCLPQLIAVGEVDPRIGILGPMVYHHNEPDIIQSAGGVIDRDWQALHRGQNQPDQGQYQIPQEVDWVSGCAILVRRAVIEQVGMIDPRFFYYYEETEWCVRARKAGWKAVHVPAAKLWHKGVQRNYKPGPNVTYYETRNRFLLFSKHGAPALAWIKIWKFIIGTLISWTFKPRWRDMREHRDAMWQGTMDFLNQRWGMRRISNKPD